MRNKLFILVSLVIAFSMVLAACAPQTVEVVKTVVVEKETVKTVEIVKEGQTIIVTTTPEPVVVKEFKSKDPTTFTIAYFGEPETLDPVLAYETAGGEIISNVYERLITYDHEKAAEFVPALATEYSVSDDGLVYTFKIREGVKFHNGNDLTPSDVAYTFQRGLLYGGYSGPQWLLAEPFFGVGNDDVTYLVDAEGNLADDPDSLKAADAALLVAACETVKSLIVADDAAGTVTMTLNQPWGPFIPTLANTWGSVMDEQWTVENGGWDGDCATWQNYYAILSENNPLTSIMNGTGPFKLDLWTKGTEMILTRNDDYWRTEPAWEGGPSGPAAFERVVIKRIDEWGTRFAMMQAGDADIVSVNRTDIAQVDPLVGELCLYNNAAGTFDECQVQGDQPFRLFKGAPGNGRTDVFFIFDIVTSEDSPNPLLGSGKLDGNGTPSNFFNDVHIRRAFNYCFDWDTYINDALAGEAIQGIGLVLPGMPGYDPNGPRYSYDPDKCAEEFQMADVDGDGIPAGQDEDDVWTMGFRLTIAYNAGNNVRQTIAQILTEDLYNVNDKFIVETIMLPWATQLRNFRASTLAAVISGWVEDIHDPHNWYQPYILGTYGNRQQIPADLRDPLKDLVNQGVAETDPAKRNEIYAQVNQMVYDDALQIIGAIATGRHYQQRWVQGYYFNPIAFGFDFYSFSKK